MGGEQVDIHRKKGRSLTQKSSAEGQCQFNDISIIMRNVLYLALQVKCFKSWAELSMRRKAVLDSNPPHLEVLVYLGRETYNERRVTQRVTKRYIPSETKAK